MLYRNEFTEQQNRSVIFINCDTDNTDHSGKQQRGTKKKKIALLCSAILITAYSHIKLPRKLLSSFMGIFYLQLTP